MSTPLRPYGSLTCIPGSGVGVNISGNPASVPATFCENMLVNITNDNGLLAKPSGVYSYVASTMGTQKVLSSAATSPIPLLDSNLTWTNPKPCDAIVRVKARTQSDFYIIGGWNGTKFYRVDGTTTLTDAGLDHVTTAAFMWRVPILYTYANGIPLDHTNSFYNRKDYHGLNVDLPRSQHQVTQEDDLYFTVGGGQTFSFAIAATVPNLSANPNVINVYVSGAGQPAHPDSLDARASAAASLVAWREE